MPRLCVWVLFCVGAIFYVCFKGVCIGGKCFGTENVNRECEN